MSDTLINKVADSGIITLDLEGYLPKEETMVFDMKEYLFMGLILKEKEYREALKEKDFTIYKGKNVAITCTADAVIPVWAYMLAASNLQPYANEIVFGNEDILHQIVFLKNLGKINPEDYFGKRVVIKGCGDQPISTTAYVEITRILRPVAKSIMYGEPCSTVPVYKKK